MKPIDFRNATFDTVQTYVAGQRETMLAAWRQHFVLEDAMHQIECNTLTPYPVLKTSGHVDRFEDLMVKDTKKGECFRADKLLEDFIENLCEVRLRSRVARAPLSLRAAHPHRTRLAPDFMAYGASNADGFTVSRGPAELRDVYWKPWRDFVAAGNAYMDDTEQETVRPGDRAHARARAAPQRSAPRRPAQPH